MKKIISEIKEVGRIAAVFFIIIAFAKLLQWIITQIN